MTEGRRRLAGEPGAEFKPLEQKLPPSRIMGNSGGLALRAVVLQRIIPGSSQRMAESEMEGRECSAEGP